MNNIDKYYDGIVTQDNRLRTTTYSSLVEFLQNPTSSCKSDRTDRIIDGLAAWVNSSNFKVGTTISTDCCLLVGACGWLNCRLLQMPLHTVIYFLN